MSAPGRSEQVEDHLRTLMTDGDKFGVGSLAPTGAVVSLPPNSSLPSSEHRVSWSLKRESSPQGRNYQWAHACVGFVFYSLSFWTLSSGSPAAPHPVSPPLPPRLLMAQEV